MSIKRALQATLLVAVLGAGTTWLMASDQVTVGSSYRILRAYGRPVEGKVIEETADAYRVEAGKGITLTVPKSQIRSIMALEPAAGSIENARLTDDQVNEILAGVDFSFLDDSNVSDDPNIDLPMNEARVEEMKKMAGDKAKVLERPHFVLVYTSSTPVANKLASRLESVYRWNYKFMEMMGVPYRNPEYKLEIFYFGTFDEFAAYQTRTAGMMPEGVLGFYMRNLNWSAFFDLTEWPPLARMRKGAEQADPQRKREVMNKTDRWAEFQTLGVIQHEAGHHMHFNTGVFAKRGDYNKWVSEGLAQMLQFPPSSAGAALGVVNYDALDGYWRIYGRGGARLPDMRRFVVDDRLWVGGASYPLGWALTHYLFHKKREGYARFMRIQAQRDDDVRISMKQKAQEFEDCFGEINEDWVKDFVSYIDSIPGRPSLIPDLGP